MRTFLKLAVIGTLMVVSACHDPVEPPREAPVTAAPDVPAIQPVVGDTAGPVLPACNSNCGGHQVSW
jgi:hypothetical protein